MSDDEFYYIINKIGWFEGEANLNRNSIIKTAKDLRIVDDNDLFKSDTVEKVLEEIQSTNQIFCENLILSEADFSSNKTWETGSGTFEKFAEGAVYSKIVNDTKPLIVLRHAINNPSLMKTGDIIYVGLEFEAVEGTLSSSNISLYVDNVNLNPLNASSEMIYHSDNVYVCGRNFTINKDNPSSAKFIIGNAYSSTDTTIKSKFKKALVINLTAVFGAGLEPTSSVMDGILQSIPRENFSRNLVPIGNIKNLINVTNLIAPKNGAYLAINELGQITGSSAINKDWGNWSKNQYTYGMSKDKTPIYNQFHGTIETDSMFSVRAKYGRWSGMLNGNHQWGGHVFEAWNNLDTYRGTIIMGKNAEDEMTIITYNPAGVETENGKGGFGTVRLGSDIPTNGFLFGPSTLTCFGNIEFDNSTSYTWGLILKSPNGSRFRLKVNDDGTLSTTKL